jgi:hypothetical protein
MSFRGGISEREAKGSNHLPSAVSTSAMPSGTVSCFRVLSMSSALSSIQQRKRDQREFPGPFSCKHTKKDVALFRGGSMHELLELIEQLRQS